MGVQSGTQFHAYLKRWHKRYSQHQIIQPKRLSNVLLARPVHVPLDMSWMLPEPVAWILTMTDIDECLFNNGNCSANCTNLDGSFECSCPSGFEMSVDGTQCIAVTTTEPETTIDPITTTTSESFVTAPTTGFLEVSKPGPTYIPANWTAFPGNRIPGGTLSGTYEAGDTCMENCVADSLCEAFDFNSAFGECYFHYNDTKCDQLVVAQEVYHMKTLPLCPEPYDDPVAVNS
ncbi:hypothetical protein CAPTEDRAFT_200664 [Capitella teleta]|uniref:EGF-like domain-containing protein n=1 Tax=Capitella teleta TaxID=283909 RepID=R7UAJ3_CAPTE|nr:hypothetical protein CAPTEDRAFT_200664 [Capitella teleta]|eukprot:ELU00161.1 hypothetical protein CAPTEDRAFT_200664 [Capitella teleta]